MGEGFENSSRFGFMGFKGLPFRILDYPFLVCSIPLLIKMKGKSKEYIKGFKHGVKWTETWFGLKTASKTHDRSFYEAVKEAVKSLKEGR